MVEKNTELLAIDWESEDLPTLPSIAHKLIEIAGRDKVEPSELSDIVSQDPTLTLKILQATNSAFYALNVEVTSIKHAIVLLGINEVKKIALGACLAKRFMTVAPEVKAHAIQLWEHLLATAILAQDMGLDIEEPDLYTLGLLHDIGWLVILAQAPKVFNAITEESELSRKDLEEAWGVDHQLWGAKLAEKWDLPEPFQVVAYRHHNPLIVMPAPPKYLVVITLANHLADFMGKKSLKAPLEPVSDALLEQLSLDHNTLADMEQAALDERERIDTLCGILMS